ncbi:ROK family transcriptional regulator [Microbacterium sp. GXF7504]
MSARTADERGGVRRQNLSRILGLVHREGPLPRAALTERTGLNRSTVADLVAELERLGLAVQSEPDPVGRVGRPSPTVCASPQVVAIAANPEVDALTVAAVALDRTVRVRARIPFDAPPSPADAVAALASQIALWRQGPLAGHRLVASGLAVPGLVRAGDGLVRDAPHLRWHDIPLADLVTEATGLPAAVGNDASLGARAEHLFGAARGTDDVVYLNGGASGIGGGLIVGGMPVGGAGGYAGEFGQNRPGIEAGADRLAPGGVLEDEVNRTRLLRALGLTAADDDGLAAALSAATDAAVHAEVGRQRRILATALANAVNVLNPSVVVLGGFLATLAEQDVPGLLAQVRAQAMTACAEDLEIRPASLAADRLLVGAAELAFEPLLADPAGV